MKSEEMDGKILYFEMHTHPPDRSALYFTKGWAKMSALSGDHVSITWPDYPGAATYKAVTFKPEFVRQFKPNKNAETFNLITQQITPDFIYIEKPIPE